MWQAQSQSWGSFPWWCWCWWWSFCCWWCPWTLFVPSLSPGILFVCSVCLRCLFATAKHMKFMRWRPCQTASWHAHIHTNKDKPAHTSTSSSPHTHKHTGTLVCLRIWLGSHFNCQSVWEINVCVARSRNSCVQFSNWSAAQLPLSPAWQRATWVSSSLPYICITAARTCTSASYHLALPLSNSQLVFNQATSLVI